MIGWVSSILVSAWLLFSGGAAGAGSCASEIARLQAAVDALAASRAQAPTAHQTVSAQLHRQPTLDSVARAKERAKMHERQERAALERARAADAKGDSEGCRRALSEALGRHPATFSPQ